MGDITILAGGLKGQRIQIPSHTPGLRPILAQIKKSLFDILKNSIEDSSFLDLFSGTGAVGFEALSRGAREVVFMEQDPLTHRRLNETIRNFSTRNPDFFERKAVTVHKADILKGLGWLGREFDLIFSGAPYVDAKKKPLYFVNRLLLLLERDRVLKKGGLFIAQHHNKETFEVPSAWKLTRQERYGDSQISFFKQI